MPTYQYACTACDHRFEAVQQFSDPSLTECPECGGRLRKVYGSVGVVFKGSGFYRTDARGGSAGTAAKDSAKDGAKDSAKGAASTGESKDAVKKDAKPATSTSAKDSSPAVSSASASAAASS